MAFSQELFNCSICFETLNDPVTASCGHSFCSGCINAYWDISNNGGRGYSCPQCRQIFNPRPHLGRNIVLNNLLEEHKRWKAEAEAAAAAEDEHVNMDDDTSSAPGDVQCDASTASMMLMRPALPEEITSRKYFLNMGYLTETNLQVDPNTVAACLSLSDDNRVISWSSSDQAHPPHPPHPDRFRDSHQALCKDGLEERHYWEVEWDVGVVDLAVSYKGIKRNGKDCCFGHNDLSWKLTCAPSACTFWHNKLHKGRIPPARSHRVGVYLDREAGTLAFYGVSEPDRLTLLHQVHTTFTEPLYPGFSVDLGATLKICQI